MLAEVEKAIVSRLSEQVRGVKILPFPESPADFGKPISSATLFVGFKQERLEAPPGINPQRILIQPRTLEYDIVFRLKDLRSHTSVYPVIDHVRDALSGFDTKVHGVFPLYELQSGFVAVVDSLWLYTATFACSAPYLRKVL
ncbi:Gp37 family protein [Leptolyngbyaceae cyanobacterium UHCC 1019]